MSRLTRDGPAEPVSRDQILRHARGQGNIYFPCSADREQDWQPYPVDPYSAICDAHICVTIIYTYITHDILCSPPDRDLVSDSSLLIKKYTHYRGLTVAESFCFETNHPSTVPGITLNYSA